MDLSQANGTIGPKKMQPGSQNRTEIQTFSVSNAGDQGIFARGPGVP